MGMQASEPEVIMLDGNYLQAVRVGRWEYVRRKNTTGIVLIVALTPANELIFVEQFRPPVQARVIELPAGLAGDIAGQEHEGLGIAAARELEEETGYRPGCIEELTHGPVSAGLTSEVVTFFRAFDLERVSDGGGDASEDIQVHRIPLSEVPGWLAERQRGGAQGDSKGDAALYFLSAQALRDG